VINYLVGGDWNHGILNDFPFHIWDVILPIDDLHHFSRWAHCTTNQDWDWTGKKPGESLPRNDGISSGVENVVAATGSAQSPLFVRRLLPSLPSIALPFDSCFPAGLKPQSNNIVLSLH